MDEIKHKLLEIHNHTMELFRLSEQDLTDAQIGLLEIEVNNIYIAIDGKSILNITKDSQ